MECVRIHRQRACLEPCENAFGNRMLAGRAPRDEAPQEKLDDRNRGVWKHMAQRNPYAVIEATAAVNARGDAGALEQRDDLAGERRLTGRPVLDLIELRRKTAEIMNRLWFGIPGHHRHRG